MTKRFIAVVISILLLIFVPYCTIILLDITKKNTPVLINWLIGVVVLFATIFFLYLIFEIISKLYEYIKYG